MLRPLQASTQKSPHLSSSAQAGSVCVWGGGVKIRVLKNSAYLGPENLKGFNDAIQLGPRDKWEQVVSALKHTR